MLCVLDGESVVIDHLNYIIKVSEFVLRKDIFSKYLISFLIFQNYLVLATKG